MVEGPGELLSAKAFAVKHIRALIHNGEFDEDGKLSIAALSEQLGVSRTPVRDALWQLAGEGLVTVSPRVGAFVRQVTPAEAKDIYGLKAAIEPLMAGWAAERADEGRRVAYREKVQELVEIAETDNVEKYI
ncbi:MAG: GntR family transcriptional regulator, partial [Pseudonocardia sp.]|nr:GntR family transcriptional regulator [Pseudonocardia sp.]